MRKPAGPRAFSAWEPHPTERNMLRTIWVVATSQVEAQRRLNKRGIKKPSVVRAFDYRGPLTLGTIAVGPWRDDGSAMFFD